MQMIWLNPRKSGRITKDLRKILRQWRLTIEEYQKETGDLGYGWYYTEKSNFGFFLRACAQLGMHFLPEFTMERSGRRRHSGLGRPDCWIRMEEGIEAYFEVKKAYNSIDGKSKNTVFRALGSAEKQLKSLKYLEASSYRVALCFITFGRKTRSKKETHPYEKALWKYLRELQESGKIDFYSTYLSNEDRIKKAYAKNRKDFGDDYSYPAIVLIGKYWRG
jgi:hypothetical protein